jgi:hypothetical protein
MTARTRGCAGGSSVRRISGRMEFGSWNGRDVEENVSQSRAASYTCAWRPVTQMS